jgi:hypothetical protein
MQGVGRSRRCEMKTGFTAASAILFGVCFLFVMIRLFLYSIQTGLGSHIQKRFDKEKIIGVTTRANFFGEQSKGGKRLRGNGAFVVTKEEVCFIRAVPFKEYVIPLKSITELSLPNSFNGKSVFSKLLCIQYKTDSGVDAIAWAIKNPESWKKVIEELMADAC